MKNIVLIIFILLGLNLFSQNYLLKGVNKGNFTQNDYNKVKKLANEVYKSLNKKNYKEGIKILTENKKLFSKINEVNFYIGISNFYLKNYNESLFFLKKYHLSNMKLINFYDYFLASSYYKLKEYKTALLFYSKFKEKLDNGLKLSNNYLFILEAFKKEHGYCTNAMNLKKGMNLGKVQELKTIYNGKHPIYSPKYLKEKNILYFTSRKAEKNNTLKDINGNCFENFYKGKLTHNKLEIIENDLENFNDLNNNAILYVNKDNTKVYLFSERNRGDIAYVEKINNKWSELKFLPYPINTEYTESSIFITDNGKTIYWVSDRPKDNIGGKDIFVAHLLENNQFSEPQNLGKTINTKYDEESLFFQEDENTLYFSSMGHNSIGGFDIFKSKMKDKNNLKFKKAVNLGININTPFDDMDFYLIDKDNAFYSSLNSQNKLTSIYKVNSLLPKIVEKPKVIPKIIPKKEIKKEIFETKYKPLRIVTVLKDYLVKGDNPLENKTTTYNHLLGFLKDNNNALVIISAHTDRKFNSNENKKITQKWLTSIKEYLIKGGAKPNQIQFESLGSSYRKTYKKSIYNNRIEFYPKNLGERFLCVEQIQFPNFDNIVSFKDNDFLFTVKFKESKIPENIKSFGLDVSKVSSETTTSGRNFYYYEGKNNLKDIKEIMNSMSESNFKEKEIYVNVQKYQANLSKSKLTDLSKDSNSTNNQNLKYKFIPVFFIKNILFENNGYDISKYHKSLDMLVKYLNEEKEVEIEIRGYADNVGAEKYNEILSKRRAKIIKNYLTQKGIDSKRLLIKGYGEFNPIAATKSTLKEDIDEVNKYNRRVEFVIKKQGENRALCLAQINIPKKYKIFSYEPRLNDDSFTISIQKDKFNAINLSDLTDVIKVESNRSDVYLWGDFKSLTGVNKLNSRFKEANIPTKIYMRIVNDVDILDSHSHIDEGMANLEKFNAENVSFSVSRSQGRLISGYVNKRWENNSIISDIIFEIGTKDLKNHLENLNTIVGYLKENPKDILTIKSYQDIEESVIGNLSLERATKINQYLVSKGVAQTQIKIIDKKSKQQFTQCKNKAHKEFNKIKSYNNRIEFFINGKKIQRGIVIETIKIPREFIPYKINLSNFELDE